MRAVVQRVSEASVTVGGRVVGEIGAGLLVYLGVAPDDGEADVDYVADRVRHARIFPDENDKMNLDVAAAGGAVLVVSAFTVQADGRKGRRPSFDLAAPPTHAEPLYRGLCERLSAAGLRVERGSFGAIMDVRSINAGPVCMLFDSKRTF